MDKTREDLLQCNHFVHIDMNSSSLSNQMNTYDERVVAGFPEQLPTKTGQWTAYDLNPRTIDEIIVGLKLPLTLYQLFERSHFLIGNGFGHGDPDDSDYTGSLKNRQAVHE